MAYNIQGICESWKLLLRLNFMIFRNHVNVVKVMIFQPKPTNVKTEGMSIYYIISIRENPGGAIVGPKDNIMNDKKKN